MTSKKINIIVVVMVIFFALFFAGSFAYESYRIQEEDRKFAVEQQQWEEQASKDNASGGTSK
ncbi:MAG: hypothetical protein E7345_04525 [Clostridiales bacterium]|nr:hypothetical protein [Clostridiales bacterium]